MEKVMEERIKNQLSLVEYKLFCSHNKEKACEECLKKIKGDVSGIRGNVSGIKEILSKKN